MTFFSSPEGIPDSQDVTTTWVVNRPHNNVHVRMSAHNNGQVDPIYYTSVRKQRDGFDEFQHVVGSGEGHGYGPCGEVRALEEVKRLLDGGWKGHCPP